MQLRTPLLLLLLFFLPGFTLADHQGAIKKILQQAEAPKGVVFEIVTADAEALHWAIPEIQRQVAQLRNTFPKLPIAVVTHGSEQMSLLKSEQSSAAKLHREVQQLVDEEEVPVHVCATFASWSDKGIEDFPEYIKVDPEGPAQVGFYQEMGYVLIELRSIH